MQARNRSAASPGNDGRGRTLRGAGGRGNPGFTLLEMLVAVGAVALIAVGVSQIFRATGTTIRTGKRLNNLNAYAAMVERQVRADVASMTRDGFLLIRHERIDGTVPVAPPNGNIPTGVALFDDRFTTVKAPTPRPRRSDQLMFFSTGDFVTARAPEHPDRVARSTAARIWYGHGLTRDPKDPNSGYDDPVKIDDDGSDLASNPHRAQAPPRLGEEYANGSAGPNQYAADWILLRHVALLATPDPHPDRLDPVDPAERNRLAPVLTASEWPDSGIQVMLQPAAGSLFRTQASDAAYFDPPLPGDSGLVRDGPQDIRPPALGSGIVDIIATDLARIRASILGAVAYPAPGAFSLGTGRLMYTDDPDSTADGTTDFMQAWMRDALPCDSDGGVQNLTGPPPRDGGRMRCEREVPNYPCSGPNWPTGANVREYRRTDQLMLTASNFVPHCTEFIVEWSFGDRQGASSPPTPNDGQIVWHGLDRWDDASPFDGVMDPDVERVYAVPYTGGATQPYRRVNGTVGAWPVKRGLIHNLEHLDNQAWPQRSRLYSYFGYLDPGFHPDINGNDRLDDPEDAAQDTMPWAWPRLLRITMSLVDPSDPSVEQTFQFVVKVPEAGAK
jgi:prepilin-type N-terminal cleavage/methylation domain-containing protein